MPSHRLISIVCSPIDSFAGIGVRIAVYIQAFLPLIPAVLQICIGRPLVDFQLQAVQSASSSLITGMALIISAIIQQHTKGLSIFHALVVLNLCWITVFGSFIPVLFLADYDGQRNITIVTHKKTVMFLLFEAKLMLMGGFGVWMLSQSSTFDSTPNPCTSSTVFWILGHHIHVTSRPFRKALLALYSTLLVPGVNIPAMVSLFLPATATLMVLGSFFACGFPEKAANASETAIFSAGLALQIAIMVVTTEKTIQSNNVGSEEQQWGLGQTYAVMVALIPALELCKQIFRILKSSPATVQDRAPSPTRTD